MNGEYKPAESYGALHLRRTGLLTPTAVRDLARRYDIRPSKALGQNFVIDPNTIRRIVKLAEIGPNDHVIEVGAGMGTLTIALAEKAKQVIAVELDKRLVPALREVVGDRPNVQIIQHDALSLDFAELTGAPTLRLVSNLPYNIATPLIATLLNNAPRIVDFVAVVQREAGERFAAAAGSKTYGAISVLVQYHCEAKVLGRVPPTVFWPAPKVQSVVVRMRRRPPVVDIPVMELMPVVKAAFGQRRKTIRNSLSSVLGLSVEDVERRLVEAGLDPGARAESLNLMQFAEMARAMRA